MRLNLPTKKELQILCCFVP